MYAEFITMVTCALSVRHRQPVQVQYVTEHSIAEHLRHSAHTTHESLKQTRYTLWSLLEKQLETPSRDKHNCQAWIEQVATVSLAVLL